MAENKVLNNETSLIAQDELNVKEAKRAATIGKIVSTTITYAFLILLALVVLFPFYWMINSSLKSLDEYRWSTPSFWPTVIHFENYLAAYNTADLGRLFMNTVIVGVVSTILSLVITILSAFAFARLEFKGRDAMFGLLMATMMIPGEMFTITNYATVFQVDKLLANLGFTDVTFSNTYAVLIIPFLVSVFYIYLLRQNFKQIPNELYYAAKVDGTSDFKYLLKVMVPIAMPTLITITILKMMGAWNSYVWPMMVTTSKEMRLITTGLRMAFTSEEGRTVQGLQMAGSTIVTAPLLIVFIILRKYIMRGVSRSGIKG